jgi:hypothetical protein
MMPIDKLGRPVAAGQVMVGELEVLFGSQLGLVTVESVTPILDLGPNDGGTRIRMVSLLEFVVKPNQPMIPCYIIAGPSAAEESARKLVTQ